MKEKNNKNSGAIIIEATISLTTFMFTIVMILFMCHICYAQAKVGTVIDGVAKDLAEFSYVYSMTGANKSQSSLSNQASAARMGVEDVCDSLNDVSEAVTSISDFASSIAGDSEMQSSLFALLKNTAFETGKSLATQEVVYAFAKNRFSGVSADAETVLSRLGIKKSGTTYLRSIDFSESVFCLNGGRDIKIVARYSVKLIELLDTEICFDIVQCASTTAWNSAERDVVLQTEPKPETTEASSQGETTTESETIPEETTTQKQETIKDIVNEATHNPASDQVMLGKFTNNKNENYIEKAESMSMTYFSVSDERWEEINYQYDAWEINKEFLKQQEAAGKTFYLNDNPNTNLTGSFAKEVLWLREQGYEFEKNEVLGIWKAVRK